MSQSHIYKFNLQTTDDIKHSSQERRYSQYNFCYLERFDLKNVNMCVFF